MTNFHETEFDNSYQIIENKLININTHGEKDVTLTEKDLVQMLDLLQSKKNHCEYCGESFNGITLHIESKCQNKHKKPDIFEKTAIYILEDLTDRGGIKHAIYEDQRAHLDVWVKVLKLEKNHYLMAVDIIEKSNKIGSFTNEWNSCDDDIKEEIKNKIAKIIKQNLCF